MKMFLVHASNFLHEARAVSALEYAILVGVVSVAILAAMATFSADIVAALTAVGTKVKAINP